MLTSCKKKNMTKTAMSHWQTKHYIFRLSFLQNFLASVKIHWQFPASEEKQEPGCVPPHLRSLSLCKLHKISVANSATSFSKKRRVSFNKKKSHSYISAAERYYVNTCSFQRKWHILCNVCRLKKEMYGSCVFCHRGKMDLLRLICQNQH